MQNNNVINAFWKAFIWLLIIFYLSLSSGNKIPKISSPLPLDKIVHFGMYFIFVLFLNAGFSHINKPTNSKSKTILVFGIALFTGLLMEGLQMSLTSTRQAEFLDAVANILGIILGLVLYQPVKKIAGKILFYPLIKE